MLTPAAMRLDAKCRERLPLLLVLPGTKALNLDWGSEVAGTHPATVEPLTTGYTHEDG